MREAAAEMEDSMVDVRKEDKTIRSFIIPSQEEMSGPIITLSSVQVIKNHEAVEKAVEISLKKREHLLLSGPNGI
jgi:ABC-type molybdenum transport system ATPase subunit/photorepair protein PhrA